MNTVVVKIILLVLMVVFGAGCSCSKKSQPNSYANDSAYVRTEGDLWDICEIIILHPSKEKPPIVLESLVEWLEQDMVNECDSSLVDTIDTKKKTIRDAWGNTIVLITWNGELSALGSKGPDGKWDNGQNDDVVVYLEDRRERLRECYGWRE